MPGVRSIIMGGATAACALGIGYIMQYGPGAQNQHAQNAGEPVVIDQVTDVSSAAVLPRVALPSPETVNPAPQAQQVALEVPDAADPSTTSRRAAIAQVQRTADCAVTLQADIVAGAMVDLTLSAPCNASERVTIHHMGLMFTEQTDDTGKLMLRVPALAEYAVFIAAFANDIGASATAEVTSLPFYDRVVLQWQGQGGLQLHAREFTDEYFSDGHIWADAAGTLGRAAAGEGGFLTQLGNPDAPEAMLAEVYSFPTGTAQRSGEVLLTVEAEVTAQNCEVPVAAQSLEIHQGAALIVREMELEMPDCDTIGDFLVLKNLVEDLTIAAR